MPGRAQYLIRIYNFPRVAQGQRFTFPKLTEVGVDQALPLYTYKDILVWDDAEKERRTPTDNRPFDVRFNDDFEPDQSEKQVLAQDVADTKGNIIKAGRPVNITDWAGSTVLRGSSSERVGWYTVRSGNVILGYASTYVFQEGDLYTQGKIVNDGHFFTSPLYANIAPCFVRGAIIETANGPAAIETLKAGDLIVTKDHGLQPLRWVGISTIRKEVMESDPRRYPVRVRAGTLGKNSPIRDCYFSRQHRILIASPNHSDDVLIPVKDLIGLPGVELADDWEGNVDYCHLVFDNHEVVVSDGAYSESMLLTEYSLSILGEAEKLQLLALRPDGDEMKSAREIVTGKPARQILRKMVNHGLHLQDVPELL